MCTAGQPSDANHNITECVAHAATETAPARRKRGGGKANRISAVPEDVVDLNHAIKELIAARTELAGVPNSLKKHERDVAVAEPMSRVNLVRKFCEAVLRHNGWKREAVK